MRRLRRCSILAGAARKSVSSGPMRETIVPGAERTRPRSPISTRQTGRHRSRSPILPASRAFSRSTATPVIAPSRRRATSASLSAGLMFGVASTIALSPTLRPLRLRRCNALLCSTRSRKISAVEAPLNGASSARSDRVPFSLSSSPGCARSSRSSVRKLSSPKRSATRSRAGKVLPASSKTAGSRSIPTRSNVRSVPLLSIARTLSSPAPTTARHTAHLIMWLKNKARFVGVRRAAGVVIGAHGLAGESRPVRGQLFE